MCYREKKTRFGLLPVCALCCAALAQASPIEIELVKENFAAIRNAEHAGNHIGYRFHEHTPMVYGETPLSADEAGFDPEAAEKLEEACKGNPETFAYEQVIEKDAHWRKQAWRFYMLPVQDGVEIRLVVETFGEGLPEYYGVQQCFRMSGETNIGWRRDVACTPAFSEYDLWEKEGTPQTSLTHVMRGGVWQALPAGKETVGARTPSGLAVDFLRTHGALEEKVGPYDARMLAPIDCPLITRTDAQGEWVCGISWERTSHVTNHHPADCLHAIVNIGNIPPFSRRAFQGKIYWFKGSKTDLAERYAADFEERKGLLRIAACQFPVGADIAANAEWIRTQLRTAKMNGAELVHFPECALSGYGGADWTDPNALDWQLLRTETESVMNLARELKLWVVLGSTHPLSGENKPHNSLYVIGPEGDIVDRYDKRFCTTGDLKFFTPGDHFVDFEVNGVRCGLLICYDVRFPELYRQYRKLGVDTIFHSFYNARHKEDCIHPKIMPVTAQARAATNAFFISLTNSSAPHSWPCHFITPDGLVQQKLPRDRPGILYAHIDTNRDYYDASAPFRMDAIDGKLISGQTVTDAKSEDRQSLQTGGQGAAGTSATGDRYAP